MGEQPVPQRPIREVGGYRLMHVLGSGGMGTVYEALDAEERRVAVKVLHPVFSADAAARQRLRREVATLHRVRGAQVARVLDAEADSADAFIVTELIDGQSLEDSVHEHGPLDAEELTDLADGLATALEAIHKVGVMHRDLKPGNVMLTDAGPVVIDFGISQLADEPRLTRTGLVTGTPGYVDPEMMRGADPGQTGDWWGWAAVLVFAATGRGPFGHGPGVLLRVESGRVDTDGLSPRVAQVLRRALHPDPQRRMRPGTVRQALADHAAGREVTSLLSEDEAAEWGVPEGAVAAPAPGSDSCDTDLDDETGGGPARPASIPPGGGAEVGHTSVMPTQMAAELGVDKYGGDLVDDEHAPVLEHLPEQYQAAPENLQQYQPEQPRPVPLLDHPGPEQAVPPWAVPAPARGWLTFEWFVALALLGGGYPTIVLAGVVAAVILFGSIGSAGRALRQRRMRRGKGKWDHAIATISYPVHLLLGVLYVLPGVIVAASGAVIVWVLGSRVVLIVYLVPLSVAVCLMLLWWTPSSGPAREGERAVLRRIAPPGVGGTILALIGVAIAVIAAVMLIVIPGAQWAPASQPPTSFF